jgi:hypothetical protein
VVVALADVFQSVVVPRAVGGRFRPSVRISRNGWQLWRAFALRLRDAERREDTLALFAPTVLIAQLAAWVALLIFGYGLIDWALRGGIKPTPTLFGAIYYAGTTLVTIGFGDVTPTWTITRLLAIVSAASGLGVVAVVTTFLFQTFGAFQRREAFIVAISERTGAPPSGVEFIARHWKLGITDDIGIVMRESQRWMAEVLETHLAYPILGYFRSSHDDESWVGTLGALLDASTIIMTTVDIDHRGQAELTFRAGTHLVRDMSHFFRLRDEREDYVAEDEFVTAYAALAGLGIPMRPISEAWPAFHKKRGAYAATLDAMARWWRIPPARWIGDRSRLRAHVNAGIAPQP